MHDGTADGRGGELTDALSRALCSQRVLDRMPIGMYCSDNDGIIHEFNRAAAELFGREPLPGETAMEFARSCRLLRPDGTPLRSQETPMVEAQRTGEAVHRRHLILERADGSRVDIVATVEPLTSEQGEPEGTVYWFREALGVGPVAPELPVGEQPPYDVDGYRQAQAEAAYLAAIVSSSDDAIVGKTLDGMIRSWNTGAERIFGYTAQEIVGQPVTRIIPPELQGQERDILARLSRGERIDHFETVRVTKDGQRIDVSLSVSPVWDAAGRIVGAAKIARDITEQKHAAETQRVLFDELNHRVKNMLATVQSIASQSLRMAASPKDFVASFIARVHALARVHDLLVHEKMKGVELVDLIREIVLVEATDFDRVNWGGPHVRLNSRVAVQMALVLHEMATNARKYGAIAAPHGMLALSWSVDVHEGERLVRLEWKESGVPEVSVPARRGFGLTLIERSLEASGGRSDIHFGGDGLRCEFYLPFRPDEKRDPGAAARSAFDQQDDEPARPNGDLDGMRVLIIEDEPLVALEMEVDLEAVGCEIAGVAPSLEAALQMVAEREFDVALLDANLAGKSVEAVAAALTRANVPFAFASGYGRDGLPVANREAPLLSKPFSPDQLVSTVRLLALEAGNRAGVVRLRRV